MQRQFRFLNHRSAWLANAVDTKPQPKSSDRSSVDGLILPKYSVAYAVPESLVRRVVQRESRFNPALPATVRIGA